MAVVVAVALSCIYLAQVLSKRLPLLVSVPVKASPIWWMAASTRGKQSTPNNAQYAAYIGIGLMLCSIGDVCLDLEEVNPNFFLVGLGAFLVGHLLYIRAFVIGHRLVVCPMRGLLFYGFAGGLVWFMYPSLPDDLVLPVILYAIAIATMGHRAATRKTHVFSEGNVRYALLGAVTFILSDSILAVNKFHTPIPHAKLYVMVTYYSAQLLMGASALTSVLDGPKTPAPSKRTD